MDKYLLIDLDGNLGSGMTVKKEVDVGAINVTQLDNGLESIANAIRQKIGIPEEQKLVFPSDFSNALTNTVFEPFLLKNTITKSTIIKGVAYYFDSMQVKNVSIVGIEPHPSTSKPVLKLTSGEKVDLSGYNCIVIPNQPALAEDLVDSTDLTSYSIEPGILLFNRTNIPSTGDLTWTIPSKAITVDNAILSNFYSKTDIDNEVIKMSQTYVPEEQTYKLSITLRIYDNTDVDEDGNPKYEDKIAYIGPYAPTETTLYISSLNINQTVYVSQGARNDLTPFWYNCQSGVPVIQRKGGYNIENVLDFNNLSDLGNILTPPVSPSCGFIADWSSEVKVISQHLFYYGEDVGTGLPIIIPMFASQGPVPDRDDTTETFYVVLSLADNKHLKFSVSGSYDSAMFSSGYSCEVYSTLDDLNKNTNGQQYIIEFRQCLGIIEYIK